MELQTGIEPATCSLQVSCSTVEPLEHMVVIAPDILGIETTNRNRKQAPVLERHTLCSAIFISHFLWWKGVYLLKHLKLDGAPLPVTARADEQSPLE